MGTFLKVFGGVSLLLVAVIVGMMFLRQATAGYSPSDDVLSAAQISRNPYKFKGKAGVMNGAFMHFSNMAGENVAVYDVMPMWDSEQLAVDMEDNEPPTTNRWWRVYVEGAGDFTNGLGAASKVAEVRFEGYTDAPPPPPALYIPPPIQPQPAPTPAPDKNGVYWNVSPEERKQYYPETPPDEKTTQSLAPIERREAVAGVPPAPKAEKNVRWTTQANGDRTLIGSNGPCATIALRAPNKVNLNLADGTTKMFDSGNLEQMKTAMQSAEDFCHTQR